MYIYIYIYTHKSSASRRGRGQEEDNPYIMIKVMDEILVPNDGLDLNYITWLLLSVYFDIDLLGEIAGSAGSSLVRITITIMIMSIM